MSPRDGSTDVPTNSVVVLELTGLSGAAMALMIEDRVVPTTERRWRRGDSHLVVLDPIDDLDPDTDYHISVVDLEWSARQLSSTFRTGRNRSPEASSPIAVTSLSARRWRASAPEHCRESYTTCGGPEQDDLDLQFDADPELVALILRIRVDGAEEQELAILDIERTHPSRRLRFGNTVCSTPRLQLEPDRTYCVRLLGVDAGGREIESPERCAAAETCELAAGDGFCWEADTCSPARNPPPSQGCAVSGGGPSLAAWAFVLGLAAWYLRRAGAA